MDFGFFIIVPNSPPFQAVLLKTRTYIYLNKVKGKRRKDSYFFYTAQQAKKRPRCSRSFLFGQRPIQLSFFMMLN